MVKSTLQFRATVAFSYDGLPHHSIGKWQTSKKLAQRDSAERALHFFVHSWDLSHSYEAGAESNNLPPAPPWDDAAQAVAENVEEAQQLAAFCCSPPAPDITSVVTATTPPRWSHTREGEAYTARVEIELRGVPHTMGGSAKASLEEACRDTARRVLWYLQCPGFASSFEVPSLQKWAEPSRGVDPDPCHTKETLEHPTDWMKDVEEQGEKDEVVEEKTVLMHLQNRLQQIYRDRIPAKQSALNWKFERDKSRPPLVRATAEIPAADESFTGDWQKCQRAAQLNTCQCVSEYLDQKFGRGRSRTSSSMGSRLSISTN